VIYPEFGDLPITQLTPRMLDEWCRKLARQLAKASFARMPIFSFA